MLSCHSLFVFIYTTCYINQLPAPRLRFSRSPFHVTSEVSPQSSALAGYAIAGAERVLEAVWEKTIHRTHIDRPAPKFRLFFTDHAGLQQGQCKPGTSAPFYKLLSAALFGNDSSRQSKANPERIFKILLLWLRDYSPITSRTGERPKSPSSRVSRTAGKTSATGCLPDHLSLSTS